MNYEDPLFIKAAAAISGALVSIKFLRGSFVEKMLMIVGGAALSFFASDTVSQMLDAQKAVGLVGFLLGIFGMAAIGKVYEILEGIDSKAIGMAVIEWLKKKWSA